MTLKELLLTLKPLIEKDPSLLNKKIALANDDEGNAYHEIAWGVIVGIDAQEYISSSYGISGVKPTNYKDYIVIG